MSPRRLKYEQACPVCRKITYPHPPASDASGAVNICRCANCGHVWVARQDGAGVIVHVTDPPPAAREWIRVAS